MERDDCCCDWFINLCNCECNYNCNCLAKYSFCKPYPCFICYKVSIRPCILSFCIPYTAVCISGHLVVGCLICFSGGCGDKNDQTNISCDKCDKCTDAYFFNPLSKMCHELFSWNTDSGDGRFFETTSYKFFTKTFCDKDSVTIQPPLQKVSVPLPVPQIPKEEELPTYSDYLVFTAISQIKLKPGNREEWSTDSNV